MSRRLLLECSDENSLLAALRQVREAGYSGAETYTPYPVEALDELLPNRRTTVSWSVFLACCLGASGGYALQYWTAVSSYPIHVGRTPLHSWPAFLPVTFELGVLAGALVAILSVLAWAGLPRYHHPVFAVPAFREATSQRFFLSLEDGPDARSLLQSLGPVHDA